LYYIIEGVETALTTPLGMAIAASFSSLDAEYSQQTSESHCLNHDYATYATQPIISSQLPSDVNPWESITHHHHQSFDNVFNNESARNPQTSSQQTPDGSVLHHVIPQVIPTNDRNSRRRLDYIDDIESKP
jgi:hypothetical protein